MPVYLVTSPQGNKLIEANTKAQAINHVTRTTIAAEVVSATAVVKLMQEGVKVERADATTPLMQEPVTRPAQDAGAVAAGAAADALPPGELSTILNQ